MKQISGKNIECVNGHSVRQGGSVLIVGLVILIILTLLGISYSQTGVMQERLAGNFRDLSVAFQSTEMGVRWPSAWLQSLGGNTLARPFPCADDCDSTDKVIVIGSLPVRPGPDDGFWSLGKDYGIDPSTNESLSMTVPQVSAQPRFVIEQQYWKVDDLAGSPRKGVMYYRVTAKGSGNRKHSDAVVRAVLAKRFE